VPARPYTETFLRSYAPGATSYVVPFGYRAVVTHVNFVNLGGAGADALVTVAGVHVMYAIFPANNATQALATKVVAYEGQTIRLSITVAGLNCTVSGYLFAETDAARELRSPEADNPRDDPVARPSSSSA